MKADEVGSTGGGRIVPYRLGRNRTHGDRTRSAPETGPCPRAGEPRENGLATGHEDRALETGDARRRHAKRLIEIGTQPCHAALTCGKRSRGEGARASAAGAPIGWVIGAREPQTPATEARILRRERLRQPRQTPAEPHPTLFNARKPAKVHR